MTKPTPPVDDAREMLLPCPFCGNAELGDGQHAIRIVRSSISQNEPWYRVRCHRCYCETGEFRKHSDRLIPTWNMRCPAPSPTADEARGREGGAEDIEPTAYDAGLFGGDKSWSVEQWHDYLRIELGSAHDFYTHQFKILASIDDAAMDLMEQRLSRIPGEEATDWIAGPDAPKEWENTFVWRYWPSISSTVDQIFLPRDFSREPHHSGGMYFAYVRKPKPPITRAPGAKT